MSHGTHGCRKLCESGDTRWSWSGSAKRKTSIIRESFIERCGSFRDYSMVVDLRHPPDSKLRISLTKQPDQIIFDPLECQNLPTGRRLKRLEMVRNINETYIAIGFIQPEVDFFE